VKLLAADRGDAVPAARRFKQDWDFVIGGVVLVRGGAYVLDHLRRSMFPARVFASSSLCRASDDAPEIMTFPPGQSPRTTAGGQGA
jgi:hypothetical protein